MSSFSVRQARTGFSSNAPHGRLGIADRIGLPRSILWAAKLAAVADSHFQIQPKTRKPVMTTRYVALCAAALLAAVALQGTSAHALSMTECSAKYKDAKAAGTLNGMKWNDFRKAQCGSDAAAAPAAAPAAATAAPAAAPAPAPKPAPAPAPVAVGNAVFPNAVDAKYSKESAGKARMETCLDQYRVNKTNNGNGGLKWIQKGGGYYSECTKKLKGA
jgi:hypothetical protein